MTTIDTILFSQRLVIADDVIFRELDGEAVLLNLKSEAYFGLDDVGVRMWTLLMASASIQEAYDQLLDEYDVEPEPLRADLIHLIQQLDAHELVVQAAPDQHDGPT